MQSRVEVEPCQASAPPTMSTPTRLDDGEHDQPHKEEHQDDEEPEAEDQATLPLDLSQVEPKMHVSGGIIRGESKRGRRPQTDTDNPHSPSPSP